MDETNYTVPLLANLLPDWSRAVPSHHPLPALQPGDVAWLTTRNVPDDVRAKWERREPPVAPDGDEEVYPLSS